MSGVAASLSFGLAALLRTRARCWPLAGRGSGSSRRSTTGGAGIACRTVPLARTPEATPSADELKKALPDLFYVASQCSAYQRAFTRFFPAEAASGAAVHMTGEVRLIFNALTEANLMFVRKSAEFFKPAGPNDKPDTLYSYRYPGYTNQKWIVPAETYEEFHKRVGHITVREARHGKVSWLIFELTMQARSQWVDFFATLATSYAADPELARYCADCAAVLRNESAIMEARSLRSLSQVTST